MITEPPDQSEEDAYPTNPQFPPPLSEGDEWTVFLVAATHAVVPHARHGVDFMVARTDRDSPLESKGWNDAVLGPRPSAEIEAEARRLSGQWPTDVNPVNAV